MMTRQANVRAPQARVIGRQRLELDFRFASGEQANPSRDLEYGNFLGVAEVDGTPEAGRAVHQEHQSFDHVVDIAQRPRLTSVAIDSQRLAGKRLANKVGYDSTIVGRHAGTIGVEDTGDLYGDLSQTPIVRKQRLGATLAFVIARAQANGVHIAVVALVLRIHLGIAIDFTCRCLKDPSMAACRELQDMYGAQN